MFKLLDYLSRQLKPLRITERELCPSSALSEWLGFDMGTRCIPLTPAAYGELIKLFKPFGKDYIAEGYLLPDTVRIISCRLVLLTLEGQETHEVLYDVRTNTYGIAIGDGFKPLEGLVPYTCPPTGLMVAVGTVVDLGTRAKLAIYLPNDLYVKWARAVISNNIEGALDVVKVMRAVVAGYEKTVEALRSQLVSAFADQATTIEGIFQQYFRPLETAERVLKTERERGGGRPQPAPP